MKLFYGAYRRAVRERNKALADAAEHKARALYLEKKLDERSDLFIEREFKLVDRMLTSTVKTYAITDEIAAKKKEITKDDLIESEWVDFKSDKIDFLEQCAREAGEANPRERAIQDFAINEGLFKQEFDAERI